MAIISLERFPFKIRFLFLKSVNGSEKDDVTQRLWFRNVAAALTVVWGQLWRLAGTTIGGWRGRPSGAGGDNRGGLACSLGRARGEKAKSPADSDFALQGLQPLLA